MTPSRIGSAYLAQGRKQLAACHARIRHCLDQLSAAQVWWRPHESMNSIGNLILHLCGNVTQWIIAGVPGAPDSRNRPQEFSQREPLAKEELIRRLEEVVQLADQVLAAIPDTQILESRRIQGFDETVLSATFGCLCHFNGHTQEIVFMTRLQVGEAYRFAWVPATVEQGAPSKVS
jgi:hypothetical protein